MRTSKKVLKARIDELEARLAEVIEATGALRASAVGVVTDVRRAAEVAGAAEAMEATERRDRRAFLKLAGAGAAAAAGGLVATARPAAANDPNDVVRNVNNPVSSTTSLTGSMNGPVLQLTNNSSAAEARALLAVANRSGLGTIRADNPAGGGYGVVGNAVNGADFQAFGSGVYAMQSHGLAGTTFHRRGDVFHVNGTLQTCIAEGTPGTLRVLAGPNTAGSLHVLPSTRRVYDSRPGNPPFAGVKAPLLQSQERVVDCKLDGAAPAGATAVMINLTVVSRSPGGFLSAFRNGVPWPGNSSINWERTGQVIANSAVVAVDAAAQFRVRASFPTDVIVDVIGYYR